MERYIPIKFWMLVKILPLIFNSNVMIRPFFSVDVECVQFRKCDDANARQDATLEELH